MISIITPFYNSINYIDKLLNSLENQSDKDFEWIIINDCSKKEETEKLKKKLKKLNINYSYYENIKNEGAGGSRNIGISHSTGEYITFVDSDDYIHYDFIKILKKEICENQFDVLFYDYFKVLKNKCSYKKIIKRLNKNILTKEEALIYMDGNVCGKLIKNNILKSNDLKFPNLKRFEDWVFMSQVVLNSKKIKYLNMALYYYCYNPYSVTQTETKDAYLYSKKGYEILEQDLKNISKEVADILYIREVMYVAIKEYSKYEIKTLKEKIYEIVDKNYSKKYIDSLNFHQRLMVWLFEKKYYYILKILGNLYK